ncbi:alanine/ornithine racemase family PLP-dependent enzyme [Mycoplasma phocoenae]|uniref:Alanine/ornithine racemase family PLP-dependent enzyme n=1 Tax=Mycoplasma phocoenae TaxID=754517 RepID=A0A858U688_9MOLU|nr:alanine/ornithine racemase family PLP-dependent enzyme [Mycoplasma phocoenae]QJG66967.1 alanine/ornithine racemase family PLP-dependent enzyme [Mycoplasma phocoenae]
MEKFPQLIIDENKFKKNIAVAKEICNKKNIEILAVTKGFTGNRRMAELYKESGITFFGDSRLDNFEVFKDIEGHKQFLKMPSIEEIPRMLSLCDSSLQGDINMIKLIDQYIEKNQLKPHDIVLMIDLGDRREGILPEDTLTIANELKLLKNINTIGIGCNFGCYGARVPSKEAMNIFINCKNEFEKVLKKNLTHISGGNSLSLHMVWENTMPKEVNFLRMGFSMIFGTEDMYRETIEGMHRDAFQLKARVVSTDYKSSMPIGKAGIDAFGHKPVFEDKGMIKRMILSIGKLDAPFDALYPVDKNIEILGGSSDYMIIDYTNSTTEYKVGDTVTFDLDWGSVLFLFNSKYVQKVFKK